MHFALSGQRRKGWVKNNTFMEEIGFHFVLSVKMKCLVHLWTNILLIFDEGLSHSALNIPRFLSHIILAEYLQTAGWARERTCNWNTVTIWLCSIYVASFISFHPHLRKSRTFFVTGYPVGKILEGTWSDTRVILAWDLCQMWIFTSSLPTQDT